MTFDEWYLEFNGGPPEDENEAIHRNDLRTAWDAATERCARIAEELFAPGGSRLPPKGTDPAVSHSAGNAIARHIRDGQP